MVSNNKQKFLIQELREFYTQLRRFRDLVQKLHTEKMDTGSEERQRESIREELVRKSGKLKPIVVHLTEKQYGQLSNQLFDVWTEALGAGYPYPSHQMWSLGALMDNVNEAIGRLEAGPGLEELFKITPSFESPKAFIAHSGETKALSKLRDFLDALGVEYSIAEREPSDGRSVEAQVTMTYESADFAIILATKGKVINKTTGKAYMGMNVADELGRARVVFKNRIILLLEKGVEPHTNINEIVHERFSPRSMDEAFTKIANELKGWNLIRALREETERSVKNS